MNKINEKSLLFLGKKNDSHTKEAIEIVQSNFKNVSVFLGEWNDKIPDQVKTWSGDFIISYLSRWVLQRSILRRAQIAAINFHPASPQYPGIGCNNFALYNNEKIV